MTIDELIAAKRGEIASLLSQRNANVQELATLRGKHRLSVEDEARVPVLRGANADIDAQLSGLEVKVSDYEAERAKDQAVDALSAITVPGAQSPSGPAYDGVARVGEAARQYRADDTRTGRPSFLRDLYASQIKRDPAAGERLARHGHEVDVDRPDLAARAASTGSVSGFVPPQYLTQIWAELARAGRPVADLCTPLPLPEVGMTFQVPRITTGTAVGVQTAENVGVTTQDIDDTLLQVPVATIAGYADMSRQSIERGILVESLVFGDLAADYNSKLDTQLINGSGSGGQHLGILGISGTNSITYTDATPTLGEMWPKLADALRKVVSQRFTGATAFVMTPDMWGWMLAATDSSGRPLIDSSNTGNNAMGSAGAVQYEGPSGALLKVPVYVSGNVPTNLGAGTNETRILTADFRDLFLAEENNGAPVQLRFDDSLSSSLGVRLLAYGYSAFIGGRQPKAISVVSGTGCIPQSL